jgi:hypothetical protein
MLKVGSIGISRSVLKKTQGRGKVLIIGGAIANFTNSGVKALLRTKLNQT